MRDQAPAQLTGVYSSRAEFGLLTESVVWCRRTRWGGVMVEVKRGLFRPVIYARWMAWAWSCPSMATINSVRGRKSAFCRSQGLKCGHPLHLRGLLEVPKRLGHYRWGNTVPRCRAARGSSTPRIVRPSLLMDEALCHFRGSSPRETLRLKEARRLLLCCNRGPPNCKVDCTIDRQTANL